MWGVVMTAIPYFTICYGKRHAHRDETRCGGIPSERDTTVIGQVTCIDCLKDLLVTSERCQERMGEIRERLEELTGE